MLVRGGQRAGHIKRANVWDDIAAEAIVSAARAVRIFSERFICANNLILENDTSERFSGVVAIDVAITSHGHLDVANVHDATGSVGAILPSVDADKDNRDQRKEDENYDGELKERHPS